MKIETTNLDENVLVVLSGGLDSSVATMMLVDKYGKDKVHALTFNYNQKQKIECLVAATFCRTLEIFF